MRARYAYVVLALLTLAVAAASMLFTAHYDNSTRAAIEHQAAAEQVSQQR